MDTRHILKDKVVLVVDDEIDVTDAVEEFEKSIEQSKQDDS